MSSPSRAPRARDRRRRRHFADDRHAEIARPARRVAADQLDAEALGQSAKTRGERGEPVVVGVGQRAGQQRPTRRRAHRREIRQVDRQRLVAKPLGIGAGEEVPAFHQHVDRQHELRARRRARSRRASSPMPTRTARIARRAAEIALDQLELVHAAIIGCTRQGQLRNGVGRLA